MKKLILFGTFFYLFGAAAFTQALRFDLINHTGVDLYGVYTTPNEEDHWGEDLLREDLFEDETQTIIKIPANRGETCSFDIKVTTDSAEDEYIEFTKVYLCKIVEITLNDDGTYEVVWIED